jgi:hypothetical protein
MNLPFASQSMWQIETQTVTQIVMKVKKPMKLSLFLRQTERLYLLCHAICDSKCDANVTQI